MACPVNPEPGPPVDPGDSTPLERDPACKLTGSLEVRLGDGNGPFEFKPLSPGQEPRLHFGAQGGHHMELGVSVANPAPEFPGLQVSFTAEVEHCDTMGCQPLTTVGQYRTRVLEPIRFLPQEGGALAVSGFIVILDYWYPDTRRRLGVEVLDRCGRTGTASLEFAATPY
jgi:hypothetical protein